VIEKRLAQRRRFLWFLYFDPAQAHSIFYAHSEHSLRLSRFTRAMEHTMKSRFRTRASRSLSRPDLDYAGVFALIVCVSLIARGVGLLPLQ
jgi:hypothetical protein